jgi:hypothetical protein
MDRSVRGGTVPFSAKACVRGQGQSSVPQSRKTFLLLLPGECIYKWEVGELQPEPRIQATWLRLLSRSDASPATGVEKLEEGYYAVVRTAAEPAPPQAAYDPADFSALESLIPNLARTRAVYLNQQSSYHLAKMESLREWTGSLAEQVERGVQHAFAVVDPEVFVRRVSAGLQASGWKVGKVQHDLRVGDGRFTENANLLRAIVQMVLSRASLATAAVALKAEFSQRFAQDANLFARFAERFAEYQPAIFDRYFTVCPECSRLAPGWDYWQVSGHDAHEAAEIFEQAMKEFESFLTAPPEDCFPSSVADCCGRSIAGNRGDL